MRLRIVRFILEGKSTYNVWRINDDGTETSLGVERMAIAGREEFVVDAEDTFPRCCREDVDDPIDIVEHPPHYCFTDLEPIDAIESWELGFHLGNVVKYVSRAGRKGERADDLRKARWYLDREIGRLEKA